MTLTPLAPSTQGLDTSKIINPKIEAYLYRLQEKHDEKVLLQMEEEAREHGFPIVGRAVGAFLEVMALSIGAKRIFEFGSGFGYSAYWFSRAVGEDGKVICSDGSQENMERGLKNLAAVGREERIEYHCGWAQEVFQTTQGDFDLIYNDVDKADYPEVWSLARDRLRPAGLYIADNALWSGRVVQEKVTDDVQPGWTEAIKEHNQLIIEDPNFDSFLNPTRDGVIVARKR